MSSDNFWYAERDTRRDDYDPRWPWMPTLQNSLGCMSLPIWFATRRECEQFIRNEVIGKDLQADDTDDGPPPAAPPKTCFHTWHCPCRGNEI